MNSLTRNGAKNKNYVMREVLRQELKGFIPLSHECPQHISHYSLTLNDENSYLNVCEHFGLNMVQVRSRTHGTCKIEQDYPLGSPIPLSHVKVWSDDDATENKSCNQRSSKSLCIILWRI